MKICESCGMPMEEKTTSKHDKRYCVYCQNQKSLSYEVKAKLLTKSKL
ncbi:hypothetical protein HY945_05275 [Candidatus Gottesmanbacteria bacterium]|nr:hypothetical protein [Candidatus Gottesmanbacteria bacterium]